MNEGTYLNHPGPLTLIGALEETIRGIRELDPGNVCADVVEGWEVTHEGFGIRKDGTCEGEIIIRIKPTPKQ